MSITARNWGIHIGLYSYRSDSLIQASPEQNYMATSGTFGGSGSTNDSIQKSHCDAISPLLFSFSKKQSPIE